MKIRRWTASVVRVVALGVPVAWMACGPSPAPSSTTTEAVVIAECDRYATAFEQCFATLGAEAETVTSRAAAIRGAARKQRRARTNATRRSSPALKRRTGCVRLAFAPLRPPPRRRPEERP